MYLRGSRLLARAYREANFARRETDKTSKRVRAVTFLLPSYMRSTKLVVSLSSSSNHAAYVLPVVLFTTR